MSADDAYYDDEEDDGQDDARGGDAGSAATPARSGRRGWMIIGGILLVEFIFFGVMTVMRSGARPVAEMRMAGVRDLAVDMLGHEVGINQVHQVIPVRGGRRMTVGMDVVLVLGQLPEERIDGAPKPTPAEFDLFTSAVRAMEPGIRSRINILLQGIPAEEYGSAEVYKTIKTAIMDDVNDALERLDFGKGLRPEIGRRRVTEVLLPMFVRQYM